MVDARQLGKQYGATLGDYSTGLREVDASAQVQLQATLRNKRDEASQSKVDRAKAESVCKDLRGRLESVEKRRAITAERREEAPANFSLVKGVLYLGLSILLIGADVSILGQVIARFLGYDWLDQNGQTFARTIFTDIPRAIHEFPDLLSLTIAVLVISLFVKIWRDSYFVVLGPSPRRIDSAEFWIYSAMLVLSLITVAGMAAARLTFDIGASQGWFSKIVSAFLGLALPLVAAGFFLKGYDSLAERWELWRLSAQQVGYSFLLGRWRSKADRLQILDETMAQREEEASTAKIAEVSALRSAFSQGYREGLIELFSIRPKLTEKLEPLVVARLLEARRQEE